MEESLKQCRRVTKLRRGGEGSYDNGDEGNGKYLGELAMHAQPSQKTSSSGLPGSQDHDGNGANLAIVSTNTSMEEDEDRSSSNSYDDRSDSDSTNRIQQHTDQTENSKEGAKTKHYENEEREDIDHQNNSFSFCDSKTLHLDTTTTPAIQAMTYSTKASAYLQQKRFEESQECYRQALGIYLREINALSASESNAVVCPSSSKRRDTTTLAAPLSPASQRSMSSTFSVSKLSVPVSTKVINQCNAAGCLRNMGAIHRIVDRYEEAIQCWQRAEQLYRDCRQFVLAAMSPSLSSPIRKKLQGSKVQNNGDECLCLDSLIAETLQSRATLHIKHQNDIGSAVHCHEQVLFLLLSVKEEQSQSWQNWEANKHRVNVEGVEFYPLTQEQHTKMLIVSLDSLAEFYRKTDNDQQVLISMRGLAAFEDALSVLRNKLQETDENFLLSPVARLLRSLSEIYFQRGELDRAVDALQDAMDLKLSRMNEEPTVDSLQALDKMGLAHEQMRNYDKALACYEKALLARNRYHGNSHIDVARSLINVGRVMELQGNTEGGLDLYRAAQKIYSAQVTSSEFLVKADDAKNILNLIPTLMEQGRYQEAVDYMNKCLEAAEIRNETGKNEVAGFLDKKKIFFDLGEAYMALRDYVSATICLVEAAKHKGSSVNEEQVFALLQRVEFLQRNHGNDSDHSTNTPRSRRSRSQRSDPLGYLSDPSAPTGPPSLDHSTNVPVEASAQRNCTDAGVLGESDLNLNANKAVNKPPRSRSRVTSRSPTLGSSSPLIAPCDSRKEPILKRSLKNNSQRRKSRPTTPDDLLSESRSDLTDTLRHTSTLGTFETGDGDEGTAYYGSDLDSASSFFTDDDESDLFSESQDDELTSSSFDVITGFEGQDELNEILQSLNKNAYESNTQAEPHIRDGCAPFDNLNDSHVSCVSPINASDCKSDKILNSESHIQDTRANSYSDRSFGIENTPKKSGLSINKGDGDSKPESSTRHVRTGSFGHDNRGRSGSATPPRTPRRLLTPPRTRQEPSVPSLRLSRTGSNVSGKSSKSRLSLRLSASRKKKEKSPADSTAFKLTKTIKGKFLRSRKEGLESFEDEKKECDLIELPKSPPGLPLENEYHAVSNPTEYITFNAKSFDSAISEITTVLDDPNSSREASQEWWWGVTAEGFGRWFQTSYVSDAVAAAEGFLSAKSIHSKVKSTPLNLETDEESLEGSAEVCDHPSNAGVASGMKNDVLSRSRKREDKYNRGVPLSPSVFSAPSASHKPGENDVMPEIKKCAEQLELQQKVLGKSHPKVGESYFDLAVLHRRNFGAESAIESALDALRIQKENGNLEDAAQTLHFLADIYLHLKQYKSSLSYYADAMRVQKKQFGYFNDEIAKTLNCIGTVRSLQNEFGLAMKSHQEALRVLKECHGEDLKHPLVSQTLCQIGSVYYRERNSLSTIKSQKDDYTTFIEAGMLEVIGRAHEDRGSYKVAVAFFEEELQLLEARTTSSPEEVATTLNSLGMLSGRAGLFVEAVEYYDRALQIQEELGCDEVHVATARVLNASVQFQLGSWHPALKLLQDSHAILQRKLGKDHETVAAALFHIGLVQAALCDYDSSMDALTIAFDIQKRLLTKDHPATLRTKREIGNVYSVYEVKFDTALEMFDEVLTAQKSIHGTKHPNIAETLHSIGCAFFRKGDFVNALRTLEECYYMRVEFLGCDHPLQATTLHEIAKIHLERGRIQKAASICDVVLSIRTEYLSECHIDTAKAVATKGSCLAARGDDMARAMKCFTEAIQKIKESVGGAAHPAIADVYVQMGVAHLSKCHFEKARDIIQEAIDMYQKANLNNEHPCIKGAIEKLERVEREEMLCV